MLEHISTTSPASFVVRRFIADSGGISPVHADESADYERADESADYERADESADYKRPDYQQSPLLEAIR
jgi:hypothetical protein